MIRAAVLAAALALPTLAEAQPIRCDRFGCSSVSGHREYWVSHVRGGRPAGCPRRYCGCALSLKRFGRIIPKLNLAWNWARTFPRVHSPLPGLIAVRRGHAMELLAHSSGDRWKVYDPNSGRGLTRIHVRSVRGFVFVDPSARFFAQAE